MKEIGGETVSILLEAYHKEMRRNPRFWEDYAYQTEWNNWAVDVHHQTYDRLYNEMCFDLVAVCRECHAKIHKNT
jgi:hypothetical protein